MYKLQLLFQMCLASPLVPGTFLSGVATSVLKRGKDPLSCDSYRPITVACNVSKVFVYVFLPFVTVKISWDSGGLLVASMPTVFRILSFKRLKPANLRSIFMPWTCLKLLPLSLMLKLCLTLVISVVYVSDVRVLHFWYSNLVKVPL